MQMNELLPCPFCGGEASVKVLEYDDDCKVWGVFCELDLESEYSHGHFVDNYPTEAEAIAAWNSRAPIEYDGWFYLPKPKEGIVQYGAPYAEEVENGYKIKQTVEVIESAIRSWGDELGDYVMKRICEVWNSRAERTCFADEVTHRDCKYSVNRGWRERTCKFTIEDNMNETEGMGDVWIECSACNCVFDYYADDWLMKMNYCPNCGARVVE